MKNPILVVSLVLLLCFAFGCQNKAEKAELEKFRAQVAVEEQNKALVVRYIDAWIKGDIEALKEIFSPDHVWHSDTGQTVPFDPSFKVLKQQIAMFSDRTISSEDLIAKGDKVVHRYIARGVHTGATEGLPATGNKFEVGGIEILRVENGKIVETWEVMNWQSFYEALGFELRPKEVKK